MDKHRLLYSLPNRNIENSGSSGFARTDAWVGAHRALGAVFDIVDRKLDLGLLSDQRVLKERHTAQEDGVTGSLKTERETERDEMVLKSPTGGRKQGQASSGVPL